MGRQHRPASASGLYSLRRKQFHAKAQRRNGIECYSIFAPPAPLREILLVNNFKLTHYQKAKGKSAGKGCRLFFTFCLFTFAFL
jgi:hypothetical protein